MIYYTISKYLVFTFLVFTMNVLFNFSILNLAIDGSKNVKMQKYRDGSYFDIMEWNTLILLAKLAYLYV